MHFNVDDIFYSQHSHQHVSAAITAIFRVILLQEYKRSNVVSSVAITTEQLKIIRISIKFMKNFGLNLTTSSTTLH
jgi:hypothetical protein